MNKRKKIIYIEKPLVVDEEKVFKGARRVLGKKERKSRWIDAKLIEISKNILYDENFE